MLQLSAITITQFKNYNSASFSFTERVVGISGLNGRGKTNLLDAIYYCCFTKSYFSKTDALNINFDKDGFRLESSFSQGDDPQKLVCIHRGTGKKELLLNDVPYEKFSQHIGKFPVVMIAPDDVELITGASEDRRRFMDTVLSQMDVDYLAQLIRYNKILQQRNSLLKRFAEEGKTDMALLEILDEQLLPGGIFLHQKRKVFTEALLPLVQDFYKQIAGRHEGVTLQYESQLNQAPFDALLLQLRQKDMILQRSNGGIHKDDISISLQGQPFKQLASQGQRKSLLFALKLAEMEMLKANKGFTPILLLDDVFEKLDEQRMQQLLHWVCHENKGQVFITDTHSSRLKLAFAMLEMPFQLIEL